jgi:hypothetical protein
MRGRATGNTNGDFREGLASSLKWIGNSQDFDFPTFERDAETTFLVKKIDSKLFNKLLD